MMKSSRETKIYFDPDEDSDSNTKVEKWQVGHKSSIGNPGPQTTLL